MGLFDILELSFSYIQYLVLLLGNEPTPFIDWYSDPLVVFNVLNLDVSDAIEKIKDPLEARDLADVVPASVPLDLRFQFFLISVMAPMFLAGICVLLLAPKSFIVWFLSLLIGTILVVSGSLFNLLPEPVIDPEESDAIMTRIWIVGVVMLVLTLGTAVVWLVKSGIRKMKDGGYTLMLQEPISKNLCVQEIMEEEVRDFDYGGQTLRLTYITIGIICGLLALNVFSWPIFPFFGSLGYFGIALASLFFVMAAGGLVWGVMSCWKDGRESLWQFSNGAQNILLSLSLLIVTVLYVPVGSNIIRILNCAPSSCPSNYHLPDVSSSFVKFSNAKRYTYPTSENFTTDRGAPWFCQPKDLIYTDASYGRIGCPTNLVETAKRVYTDRSVQCTDTFRLYMGLAAGFMLVAYIVGLAVLQYILTNRATDAVENEYPLDARQSIGLDFEQLLEEKLLLSDNVAKIIYGPFQRDYRYWRMWALLHRFFLIFASTLFFDSSISSTSLSFILSFSFHAIMLFCMLIMRPYSRRIENWFGIATQAVLTAVSALGLGSAVNDLQLAPTWLYVVVAVMIFFVPILALIVGGIFTKYDNDEKAAQRARRIQKAIEQAIEDNVEPDFAITGVSEDAQKEPEIGRPLSRQLSKLFKPTTDRTSKDKHNANKNRRKSQVSNNLLPMDSVIPMTDGSGGEGGGGGGGGDVPAAASHNPLAGDLGLLGEQVESDSDVGSFHSHSSSDDDDDGRNWRTTRKAPGHQHPLPTFVPTPVASSTSPRVLASSSRSPPFATPRAGEHDGRDEGGAQQPNPDISITTTSNITPIHRAATTPDNNNNNTSAATQQESLPDFLQEGCQQQQQQHHSSQRRHSSFSLSASFMFDDPLEVVPEARRRIWQGRSAVAARIIKYQSGQLVETMQSVHSFNVFGDSSSAADLQTSASSSVAKAQPPMSPTSARRKQRYRNLWFFAINQVIDNEILASIDQYFDLASQVFEQEEGANNEQRQPTSGEEGGQVVASHHDDDDDDQKSTDQHEEDQLPKSPVQAKDFTASGRGELAAISTSQFGPDVSAFSQLSVTSVEQESSSFVTATQVIPEPPAAAAAAAAAAAPASAPEAATTVPTAPVPEVVHRKKAAPPPPAPKSNNRKAVPAAPPARNNSTTTTATPPSETNATVPTSSFKPPLVTTTTKLPPVADQSHAFSRHDDGGSSALGVQASLGDSKQQNFSMAVDHNADGDDEIAFRPLEEHPSIVIRHRLLDVGGGGGSSSPKKKHDNDNNKQNQQLTQKQQRGGQQEDAENDGQQGAGTGRVERSNSFVTRAAIRRQTQGWRKALVGIIANQHNLSSKSKLPAALQGKHTRELLELQKALSEPIITAADEKRVKKHVRDVYESHLKSVAERQEATDYRVNRDTNMTLLVFFTIVGLLSFVALGVTSVGLTVMQREERSTFLPPNGLNAASAKFQYRHLNRPLDGAYMVLAGYNSWNDFVNNCCCTSFDFSRLNVTDSVVAVEKWICRNGLVKERLRKTQTVSSILSVRHMCSSDFLNLCTVSVAATAPNTVTLTGCAASVSAAEQQLW